MDACLIFNPAARGHRASLLREHLAELARQCALKLTFAPGSARELARDAVQQGFTTIIAGGGDGTINEVLNGIGDVPDGFRQSRLGILPLGTVNVFAKELNLPPSFNAAWQVIQHGQETSLDLPYADFQVGSTRERRYFIQLAGAGADTMAIDMVDPEDKKRWGAAAYALAGFQALSDPKPRIIASAAHAGAAGEQVLIGNGRFYGGRFRVFPKASLTDGLLDVMVLPRANWKTLLQAGWAWLADRLHETGGAIHFQADQFSLSSEKPVALELDGENVGHLPATFRIVPRGLRVLTPPPAP